MVRRSGGDSEMLHELLLALVGCTGDVFLDAREQQQQQQQQQPPSSSSCSSSPPADACTFHLAPDLTFLQHSERYVPPSCSLFGDTESKKNPNPLYISMHPHGETD